MQETDGQVTLLSPIARLSSSCRSVRVIHSRRSTCHAMSGQLSFGVCVTNPSKLVLKTDLDAELDHLVEKHEEEVGARVVPEAYRQGTLLLPQRRLRGGGFQFHFETCSFFASTFCYLRGEFYVMVRPCRRYNSIFRLARNRQMDRVRSSCHSAACEAKRVSFHLHLSYFSQYDPIV